MLEGAGRVDRVELNMSRPDKLRELPNDAGFPQQWYLKNDLDPGIDANVVAAWDMGYTGAGVLIGITDTGLRDDHPDLAANFRADASQPGGTQGSHGTSVAGIAAGVANNGVGMAGTAYGAWMSQQKIGNDLEDAAAIGFRNDLNDVKCNSWGPADDQLHDVVPAFVMEALEDGVLAGPRGSWHGVCLGERQWWGSVGSL